MRKARIVVKGNTQKKGEDYNEVFTYVSRLETIWLIISLAVQNNWKLFQMNVKSTFLNHYIEEKNYVVQSLEFVKKGEKDKVYNLKKALYWLQQSSHVWYSWINYFFEPNGF